MALRVISTTDGKYLGTIAPIDPRNPPASILIEDGTVFDPIEWTEFEPGMWRIRNPHYCVWAEEV